MKNRIQKWGNSLAVRIPKSFAEDLGWSENSPVEMTLEADSLVIKTDKERVFDLDELLTGVTGENVHPAWETGSAGPARTEGPEEDAP